MIIVPCILLMLVMVLVILRIFPIGSTFAISSSSDEPRPVSFSRREWFAMVVLVTTLSLWLLGGRWNLPLPVPAILAATIFALPPVGLVTRDSMQKQNWDEILVVGSGLSLGAMLSETGAIAWLAGYALELLPQNPSAWVVYLFTALLAFLVRRLFLAPSPCMVITLPIVIELGRITGTDPLLVAMLAAGVIGAVQVVPVQSPPTLLCLLNGLYTTRDQLRLTPYFLLAIAVIMLGAVTFYWPLLQVWGWIP